MLLEAGLVEPPQLLFTLKRPSLNAEVTPDHGHPISASNWCNVQGVVPRAGGSSGSHNRCFVVENGSFNPARGTAVHKSVLVELREDVDNVSHFMFPSVCFLNCDTRRYSHPPKLQRRTTGVALLRAVRDVRKRSPHNRGFSAQVASQIAIAVRVDWGNKAGGLPFFIQRDPHCRPYDQKIIQLLKWLSFTQHFRTSSAVREAAWILQKHNNC